MTRTDILIRFIKKSIVPIITAILLYNLFAGLCIANGNLNYMYLLMLCGIPFGIRFMFTLPVFIGNPGVGIFMTAANIAIGAVIGGIILIWKLLVAVCYVPYTAVKLITAQHTKSSLAKGCFLQCISYFYKIIAFYKKICYNINNLFSGGVHNGK